MKPKRGKFTVNIIFFDATTESKNYTICKINTRSIFPTDSEDSRSAFSLFQSKLYFTMNSLEHR